MNTKNPFRTLIVDNADDDSNRTKSSASDANVVNYDDGIRNIGRGRGRNASSSRTSIEYRVDWRAWLIGAVVVLAVVLGGGWYVINFIQWKYTYDNNFRTFIDWLVIFIFLAAFGSFVVYGALLVQWGYYKSQLAGLVVLPGNWVAHIKDVVGGWQNEGSRSMTTDIMSKHFDVQGRAADKSLYRNAQYISNSNSNTTAAAAKDDDQMHVRDNTPTLADLLGINALEDGADDNET